MPRGVCIFKIQIAGDTEGIILKIESHDDIDEIVRKMRYSILSTLENLN